MYSFNDDFIKIEKERNTLRKLNSKLSSVENEINLKSIHRN